jgi:hypothetical protein
LNPASCSIPLWQLKTLWASVEAAEEEEVQVVEAL